MFNQKSRYAVIQDLIYDAGDGRRIVYKGRRLLPQPGQLPLQQVATVAQGERLDLIAARTLGQSQLYWRIADANTALWPNGLVSEPGRKILIPSPSKK